MSLALERLRHRVASSTDERARAFAVTRLSIELAQLGRPSEAREHLEVLQRSAVVQESGVLAIYLVLIDGLCSYYDGLETRSIDRLSRAYALARASQDKRLIGESGVWLSLAAYTFDKSDLLEESLTNAAECTEAMEPSTKARLVGRVADLFQLAGLMNEAALWYSHARRFARIEQDDAVLVATEFNRLAAGLTRLKYEEFLGWQSPAPSTRAWGIEVSSVESLHRAYQSESLGHLLVLCASRNKYICGDFLGAIPLLEVLHDGEHWSAVGLCKEALSAELAWCRFLAHRQEDLVGQAFPSLVDISQLDPNMRIDCLYYASQIGSRVFASNELVTINEMLSEAREKLIFQIEFYRNVALRVSGIDRLVAAMSLNG